MLFKRKIDRVVNVEKAEKEFKETLNETKLEKNDTLAMIIAACIVFVPAIIIVAGIFLLVISFFF